MHYAHLLKQCLNHHYNVLCALVEILTMHFEHLLSTIKTYCMHLLRHHNHALYAFVGASDNYNVLCVYVEASLQCTLAFVEEKF